MVKQLLARLAATPLKPRSIRAGGIWPDDGIAGFQGAGKASVTNGYKCSGRCHGS